MPIGCTFVPITPADFTTPEKFLSMVKSEPNSRSGIAYPGFVSSAAMPEHWEEFYNRLLNAMASGAVPLCPVEDEQHMFLADARLIFQLLSREKEPDLASVLEQFKEGLSNQLAGKAVLAHFSSQGTRYEKFTSNDFDFISQGLLVARAKGIAKRISEYQLTHFFAEQPLLDLVRYHYILEMNSRKELTDAKEWGTLGFLKETERRFYDHLMSYKSPKVQALLDGFNYREPPRGGLEISVGPKR